MLPTAGVVDLRSLCECGRPHHGGSSLLQLGGNAAKTARCNENVLALREHSFRQTSAPNLDSSSLRHKIQRAATRRLFFHSSCRAPIGPHRLGDSQIHAALLAGVDFRWLRQGAHLALLADVDFSVQIDGQRMILRAGGSAFAPRGTAHADGSTRAGAVHTRWLSTIL